MRLARIRRGGWFERFAGGEAIRTIKRQRRQNSDRNDNRRNILDTRLSGKRWADRQISFIESSFRQVYPGYSAATNRRPEQKQAQYPPKSLHVTSLTVQ